MISLLSSRRLPPDSIMKNHRQTSADKRRGGFSLAELMVVIVIIGLLATLVVPKVVSRLFKAQRETAKINIQTIASAVTEYQIDNNGVTPDSLQALVDKDENGNSYLDMDRIPVDPWDREYGYEPAQGGLEFRVFTYGKDGEPGGDGDDRDLDNIMIKNGEA